MGVGLVVADLVGQVVVVADLVGLVVAVEDLVGLVVEADLVGLVVAVADLVGLVVAVADLVGLVVAVGLVAVVPRQVKAAMVGLLLKVEVLMKKLCGTFQDYRLAIICQDLAKPHLRNLLVLLLLRVPLKLEQLLDHAVQNQMRLTRLAVLIQTR
jgi:hypothetical protein